MNEHILYLIYILYIYRSDKFVWKKLRANILAAVFLFCAQNFKILKFSENKSNLTELNRFNRFKKFCVICELTLYQSNVNIFIQKK